MEVLNDKILTERREKVFLILAGLFLGAMTMLNIIGITRFVQIGPMALAVGVLPYPITFLCTDLIGELYGRHRATFLVWVGLGLNIFVVSILYIGNLLPSATPEAPWQTLFLAKPVPLPTGETLEGQVQFFNILYACTAGSVFASMVAYMAAQFCDVYLFHFWKRLTKGKMLWVRNNFSTLISQLVDSITVIGITFGMVFFKGEMGMKQILILLGSNYLFKMVAAILDTGPLYVLVHYLSRYLRLDPEMEHDVKKY